MKSIYTYNLPDNSPTFDSGYSSHYWRACLDSYTAWDTRNDNFQYNPASDVGAFFGGANFDGMGGISEPTRRLKMNSGTEIEVLHNIEDHVYDVTVVAPVSSLNVNAPSTGAPRAAWDNTKACSGVTATTYVLNSNNRVDVNVTNAGTAGSDFTVTLACTGGWLTSVVGSNTVNIPSGSTGVVSYIVVTADKSENQTCQASISFPHFALYSSNQPGAICDYTIETFSSWFETPCFIEWQEADLTPAATPNAQVNSDGNMVLAATLNVGTIDLDVTVENTGLAGASYTILMECDGGVVAITPTNSRFTTISAAASSVQSFSLTASAKAMYNCTVSASISQPSDECWKNHGKTLSSSFKFAVIDNIAHFVDSPLNFCDDGVTTLKDGICVPCRVCTEDGFEPSTACLRDADTGCAACEVGLTWSVGGAACMNCTQCDPLKGTHQTCNTTTDTICRDCPLASYTWDYDTGLCKECISCGVGMTLDKSCNVTHDTQCKYCDEGTTSPGGGTCTPCIPCEAGYEVATPCNATHEAVCKMCTPNVRYEVNGTCTLCSTCSAAEMVSSKCTAISDIICAPIKCPTLTIEFAVMAEKCTDASIGDICSFECQEGYVASTTDVKTCSSSGQWQGPAWLCIQSDSTNAIKDDGASAADQVITTPMGEVNQTTGIAAGVGTVALLGIMLVCCSKKKKRPSQTTDASFEFDLSTISKESSMRFPSSTDSTGYVTPPSLGAGRAQVATGEGFPSARQAKRAFANPQEGPLEAVGSDLDPGHGGGVSSFGSVGSQWDVLERQPQSFAPGEGGMVEPEKVRADSPLLQMQQII
eukprot:TRINITY_DN831_c0_g1_i2.p1 TRINITY_DN831_c0_g1~~TRINITY_DN831_c0_g1_i2.p1  ORF type:complete len:902 (-),score=153.07 TRINITY_DN831_c0_g1_i2:195-2648(-)